ncbi:MAG: flippase-like domain-containing protein [Hydrotalea flava]|uniref:lysylphosphatidylglycerol synthase transmembrane domain-containing protein n=1 Tax=Hydrotalea lipotrueae TaxID=2803817 RepID=UPI0016AAC859|nr:lysylphosphatidylglycerol synthase transmembrane domain-containing protein [Hydrotalea lipotrueae]NIM35041.1 flippase-like domain-containing protein [Hydrotalea flava]NIM37867.1 flippase-like domain-containing protein [Hydrotalea flava]NIN03036.1 flippase-like domain-containing protein [Hydrotalea flava]NIN14721.1 flippase-like domain-containing protein [Hydrotalea flava]NIO93793.1 flippase-like domain-containing protein [Hydrotalea flava]
MKRKLKVFVKYLFFLGLGIFLVWWSLHQIPANQWGEFTGALTHAKYILFIPVFFILTLSHILRALRWKILMQPMGYKPSVINTYFAVMIGYLANLAVPRLGEVLKCTLLARYEKVPAEKLVGTIVAERAFDVLSLGIVFLLALLTQYEIIGDYAIQLFKETFQSKSGGISVRKMAIAMGILLIIIVIIRHWFNRFAHLKLVIQLKKIIRGIWEGLSSIKDIEQKGLFIFYSFGIWLLYLLGTWVGFYATVGTNGLAIPVAFSALAFASIGMIVTPGGIGAYAYLMAMVLEKNGIAFGIGYANGTLQWFAQFIIILIWGFVCLGLLPWYNKKRMVPTSQAS